MDPLPDLALQIVIGVSGQRCTVIVGKRDLLALGVKNRHSVVYKGGGLLFRWFSLFFIVSKSDRSFQHGVQHRNNVLIYPIYPSIFYHRLLHSYILKIFIETKNLNQRTAVQIETTPQKFWLF